MHARNRRTGSPIVGTLERLTGRADSVKDKFQATADGPTHEYDGYTKVFWDDQRTVTRQGETAYLDEDGTEVVGDEVELVQDLQAPLTPVPERPPAADLEEEGRETNFTDRATLYEVVRPDGSGHGLYTTVEAAHEQARPCDRIAEAVYTRTDQIGYAEEYG